MHFPVETQEHVLNQCKEIHKDNTDLKVEKEHLESEDPKTLKILVKKVNEVMKILEARPAMAT